MQFTIEQAEYHRNGVSGHGFYAGIVNCELDGYGWQRMLVTFFPHLDEEGEPQPAGTHGGKLANVRLAVVSLDMLPTAGVGVGNKWRGDNFYEVADALVAEVRSKFERSFA